MCAPTNSLSMTGEAVTATHTTPTHHRRCSIRWGCPVGGRRRPISGSRRICGGCSIGGRRSVCWGCWRGIGRRRSGRSIASVSLRQEAGQGAQHWSLSMLRADIGGPRPWRFKCDRSCRRDHARQYRSPLAPHRVLGCPCQMYGPRTAQAPARAASQSPPLQQRPQPIVQHDERDTSAKASTCTTLAACLHRCGRPPEASAVPWQGRITHQ